MRECLYWIKIHFVCDLITYWILWYLLQYEVFASCHACMIWRHLCKDDHVKSKQRKSCINVLLLNHYFYNITPLALSWGKILFCFNYEQCSIWIYMHFVFTKLTPLRVLYFVFQSSTSMWVHYHIWTSNPILQNAELFQNWDELYDFVCDFFSVSTSKLMKLPSGLN